MARNKLHVKTGDRVEVLAGKDKGKRGKILRTLPTDNRVIVEGVNIIKKHQRPTQQNPQGGIIDKEAAIHVSNVNLVCPKCRKSSRTGKKILADGSKVRYCKTCSEVLDK